MAIGSALRYFILWHCAINGLNSLLTGLGYAILTRDFPVFSLSPTAFRVKCHLQDCGILGNCAETFSFYASRFKTTGSRRPQTHFPISN